MTKTGKGKDSFQKAKSKGLSKEETEKQKALGKSGRAKKSTTK